MASSRCIAEFTVAAAEDPKLVETITGRAQVFSGGGREEAAFFHGLGGAVSGQQVTDPEVENFVAPLRPLSNSKLGGNLTKLYKKEPQ